MNLTSIDATVFSYTEHGGRVIAVPASAGTEESPSTTGHGDGQRPPAPVASQGKCHREQTAYPVSTGGKGEKVR
jgi:hypothetical protein